MEGVKIALKGETDITSTQGVFELTQVPAGTALIRAEAEGYQTYSENIQIREGSNTHDIQLERSSCATSLEFVNNSIIQLASQTKSFELLGTSDDYASRFHINDIRARTQDMNASTEQDYLDFAANQALAWSESDCYTFNYLIERVKEKFEVIGINPTLPDTIFIVRSTMAEEGGAKGYVRDSKFIVMNSIRDEGLFLHELFHVYSGYNPLKRDRLYSIVSVTLLPFPNHFVNSF